MCPQRVGGAIDERFVSGFVQLCDLPFEILISEITRWAPASSDFDGTPRTEPYVVRAIFGARG